MPHLSLISARSAALERAERFSPFLREASGRRPAVVQRFEEEGADAAIAAALSDSAADTGATLRRQRDGLALAVALGDLSGELPLERVTGALSDFADHAIDQAIRAAVAERVGDVPFAGLTMLALGKIGSHEQNGSSDVDVISL
jgi:glutamate-ammonia-ligase adenylyltransferase